MLEEKPLYNEMVRKNRNGEMKMVPTTEEIEARYLARKGWDTFSFEVGEYLPFCSFDFITEHRKFKEGVDLEKAKKEYPSLLTRERMIAIMKDYMPFAFEKANNERGISANRSIGHYIAWTWLAGDTEFSKKVEDTFDDDYHSYGKPILRMICKQYGWDYCQWEDEG
jgi:hypothetical protein